MKRDDSRIPFSIGLKQSENKSKIIIRKWSCNLKALKETAGVVQHYYIQHSLSTELNTSVGPLALVLSPALKREQKQSKTREPQAWADSYLHAKRWSLGCY